LAQNIVAKKRRRNQPRKKWDRRSSKDATFLAKRKTGQRHSPCAQAIVHTKFKRTSAICTIDGRKPDWEVRQGHFLIPENENKKSLSKTLSSLCLLPSFFPLSKKFTNLRSPFALVGSMGESNKQRRRHPEPCLDFQEFLKGHVKGACWLPKETAGLTGLIPNPNAIECHRISVHLPQNRGTTIARQSRRLPGIRGYPSQRGFLVREELLRPQELLRRPCRRGFADFQTIQRWSQLGCSLAGQGSLCHPSHVPPQTSPIIPIICPNCRKSQPGPSGLAPMILRTPGLPPQFQFTFHLPPRAQLGHCKRFDSDKRPESP